MPYVPSQSRRLRSPDKGEGPASEYESFEGPSSLVSAVAAGPTTRSPDRPRIHRASPRTEVLGVNHSFVLPRFSLRNRVRDLYPPGELPRKRKRQITSLELCTSFVHRDGWVVHPLSTGDAQGYAQPLRALRGPRSPALAGGCSGMERGDARSAGRRGRARGGGVRKGPRASMSRSTGPSSDRTMASRSENGPPAPTARHRAARRANPPYKALRLALHHIPLRACDG